MAEKKQEKNPQNSSAEGRAGKGTPPKVGNEGGVVEEGTGDFAPDNSGATVDPEIGADGVNPVSAQNPPRKAMIGGGREVEAAEGTEAKDRNEGADITSDLKDPETEGVKGGGSSTKSKSK
jgi:hypothetical protein